VKAVVHLPPQLNYLAVHSLYWVARAYLAENNKKGAECLLLRAKRYKKSEFPIDGKIERVLSDVRASA